jgi:dTDP-4-dehydrorhamnose 3,5-epimerase
MGQSMNLRPTKLSGVIVAESVPVVDHRGAFARFYCGRELSEVIGARHIVQINHSRTVAVGSVRGFHFQRPPRAEMKLVRCLKGRVWDVAADLRAESQTFLQWHAEELTPENGCMLVIPEGCAHAFQTLAPDSELLYLHTASYDPTAESGVRCDDPRLGVSWPLPIGDLSARDRGLPTLDSGFRGVVL